MSVVWREEKHVLRVMFAAPKKGPSLVFSPRMHTADASRYPSCSDTPATPRSRAPSGTNAQVPLHAQVYESRSVMNSPTAVTCRGAIRAGRGEGVLCRVVGSVAAGLDEIFRVRMDRT